MVVKHLFIFVLAAISKTFCKTNFDFLVFTQMWPITSCEEWQTADSKNICNLPQRINGRWTIHGIWPSVSHGSEPFFCDKTKKFDPMLLTSIMPQLEVQWVKIYENIGKDFWQHEWMKHGTCALQLQSFNNEFKYFSKALEWNNKYEIGSILSKAGITPGDSYTGRQVLDAVQRAIGKKPRLECIRNAQNRTTGSDKKFLLSQVLICFTKDLRPTDCSSKSFKLCNQKKKINFYPTDKHLDLTRNQIGLRDKDSNTASSNFRKKTEMNGREQNINSGTIFVDSTSNLENRKRIISNPINQNIVNKNINGEPIISSPNKQNIINRNGNGKPTVSRPNFINKKKFRVRNLKVKTERPNEDEDFQRQEVDKEKSGTTILGTIPVFLTVIVTAVGFFVCFFKRNKNRNKIFKNFAPEKI